jgi:streptogramin lyase
MKILADIFIVNRWQRSCTMTHLRSAALLLALCSTGSAQYAITEYSAGITPGSVPFGITAGPDGALWFTEPSGNRIGRITTAGVINEYSIGLSANSNPSGIVAGPDGALWFTESVGNRIGRITTAGVISEYSSGLSANSNPSGIAAGPDGALWFTEAANRIGRITTGGVITEYSLTWGPSSAITAGPDGALWFTESSSNRIGRITTGGVVTDYYVFPKTLYYGIAAGSDGALWFTMIFAGHDGWIGRITTGGVVNWYSTGLSANSGPNGIAAGPDGALWFTEGAGRIGRITAAGTQPISTPALSTWVMLLLAALLATTAAIQLRRRTPLYGPIISHSLPTERRKVARCAPESFA